MTQASSVEDYPEILRAITDPVRRKKLERIRDGLKDADLLGKVYYGVGGMTFREVDKYLVSTEGI